MTNFKLIVVLHLVLVLSNCKPDDEPEPFVECTIGCTNISELTNKRDYLLPFSLVNDNEAISKLLLNNELINIPLGASKAFPDNGFFELVVFYNNSKPSDTILFTTTSQERQNAEWGIRAWIPSKFITTYLGNEEIQTFYPRHYAENIKVPFVFYIRSGGQLKPIYLNASYAGSGAGFFIKQGVGSVNIPAGSIHDQPYFNIGDRSIALSISKKDKPDMVLSGLISEKINVPANSFVKITGNVDVAENASITFGSGCLVLIDKAININHEGPITFLGSEQNPVFVTCSDENNFWGGFITSSPKGIINASYTIFCQSGFHDSNAYNWGHARRQALFYTQNTTLTLNNCFMLDHIGQIFYPQNSTITLNNILVQRTKTGGQINNSFIKISNSIFTDFPDDSFDYKDDDNDALYISASDAIIYNSIFMFAKDDGLDSGNDDGGEVFIANTLFEACFHEGAALSSKNQVVKNHTFLNCTFRNCGQGIELGFSSPNHTVITEKCIFERNGIGVRFGDNYNWSYVNGKIYVRKSDFIKNEKDSWNMVRMNWQPKPENLIFEN